MRDATLNADGRWIAAQRGANRDRRVPVVGASDPVGHWGDPRVKPFDPRIKPFRLLSQVPALIACMAPVGFLALLWSRLP